MRHSTASRWTATPAPTTASSSWPAAHPAQGWAKTAQADAEKVARAIAESQLFKCAVAGGDPNWGRIICAVGYSGADVRAECTTVHIGQTCVVRNGTPTAANAADQMQDPEVRVTVDLGLGTAESAILTCDLTKEYVRINADYHT